MLDSLLDTDLYKFTMMQVVLHQFPGAQVEYRFRCRTEAVDLLAIEAQFRAALTQLCALRFNEDELSYLRALSLLKLWDNNKIHFDPNFCELQVAGSGTKGVGRYKGKEETKNQQFLIQIIPKIGKIENTDN